MSAKGLLINNYSNGINSARLIVDPALNIIHMDWTPTTGSIIDIWLKGGNSPYTIKFPSPPDLEVAKTIIAMAISGAYDTVNGADGTTYTPSEDAQGIVELSNLTRTGTLPTTTTTTAAPTTTTTTSGGTTTTTSSTTTTTTLFPATLNYSFTKASGITASFTIYRNGTAVVTRSSTGAGSYSVTAGDSVYARITSTNSVTNVIDLGGGTGGATALQTVGGTGTRTLTSFTVANGNNYHIDGTSDPV